MSTEQEYINKANANYGRRLVVDFDDTLALLWDGVGSIQEALPNHKLIEKLNLMFTAGFEVVICTARGSLSCKTREEADHKYRTIIEEWLSTHKVSYTSISFNKELGIAYIDDKAYTPTTFAKQTFTELKGRSGYPVVRIGDTVIKTDKRAKLTARWFNKCGYSTPTITSVIGDTLVMEYVSGKTLTETLVDDRHDTGNEPSLVEVDRVLGVINRNYMRSNRVLTDQKTPDRNTYGSRIIAHWVNSSLAPSKSSMITEMRLLSDRIGRVLAKINYSNYHGDMSCENIIVASRDTTTIKYIDPIILPDVWYSSVLDAAKLSGSILMHTREDLTHHIWSTVRSVANINYEEFVLLMSCELIRTYKYCDSTMERNYIHHLVESGFAEDIIVPDW